MEDKVKIGKVAFKKTDTKKCGWCDGNHKWIDCETFIFDTFHEEGAKGIIRYVKTEKFQSYQKGREDGRAKFREIVEKFIGESKELYVVGEGNKRDFDGRIIETYETKRKVFGKKAIHHLQELLKRIEELK